MGANTIINLQKIYSLEKKPHLSKIHSDVIDFVEEQHPELFKQAVDDVGNYNPANPTIVDSYISVVHLMMLEKIPIVENHCGTLAEISLIPERQ